VRILEPYLHSAIRRQAVSAFIADFSEYACRRGFRLHDAGAAKWANDGIRA